jgi:hypothetical protein
VGVRIQITFKGDAHDIAISGDSVDQILAEYAKISKKLGSSSKSQLRPPERSATAERSPAGTRERILRLKAEGFFKKHRTLNEVRQELAKKGLRKPITALSGPLKDLVRDDKLKRDQKKDNGREIWVYFA